MSSIAATLPSPFDFGLPNELLCAICFLLDKRSLLNCRSVCHRWNDVLLDKLVPTRLTLAIGRMENNGGFPPDVVGEKETEKIDPRLWQNLSYHGKFWLSVFLREVSHWERVRGLDISVLEEHDLKVLESAINSSRFDQLETLTLRFADYEPVANSLINGDVHIGRTLTSLKTLRFYRAYSHSVVNATENGIVQCLVNAAPNLRILTCFTGGMVLFRLPSLTHLEIGSTVSFTTLSGVSDSLVSLSLEADALDLGNFPTFAALKELRILATEGSRLGRLREGLREEVMRMGCFPNLEKISEFSLSGQTAFTFIRGYFLYCKESGYRGLKLVELTVPNPRTSDKNWKYFKAVVLPVLPEIKRLTLFVQSDMFSNITGENLQLILDIPVPHLVLEAVCPWKTCALGNGIEAVAFPFGELLQAACDLPGGWKRERGGVLELRGGGVGAESLGEIHRARFSAAVWNLRRGWGLIRLNNFMVGRMKADELLAEIRKHSLPVEIFFGILH